MTENTNFITGFVPNHNHSSINNTSIDAGHVHQFLDITFPASETNSGGHIHYLEGYVLYENEHVHRYEAWTTESIPVGNGLHIHYYDFNTSENNGHRHRVVDVLNPAPGTL